MMESDILPFIAVMTLIVLAFGTFAGERNRKHKIRKLELEARIAEAQSPAQTAEKEVQAHLEDRVRVLERLATDRSALLSDEIEQLRGSALEHQKDEGNA